MFFYFSIICRSGTEEEYEEKENLLQELIEIQRDAKEKEQAKKKKNKEEEKKVNQGLAIQEKALETFKRKHEGMTKMIIYFLFIYIRYVLNTLINEV